MHYVQLVDTTCLDKDEDEEAWGPPRLAPISVRRFLDIEGRDSELEVCRFGRMPVASRFGDFPLFCEEDFLFLLPNMARC